MAVICVALGGGAAMFDLGYKIRHGMWDSPTCVQFYDVPDEEGQLAADLLSETETSHILLANEREADVYRESLMQALRSAYNQDKRLAHLSQALEGPSSGDIWDATSRRRLNDEFVTIAAPIERAAVAKFNEKWAAAKPPESS